MIEVAWTALKKRPWLLLLCLVAGSLLAIYQLSQRTHAYAATATIRVRRRSSGAERLVRRDDNGNLPATEATPGVASVAEILGLKNEDLLQEVVRDGSFAGSGEGETAEAHAHDISAAVRVLRAGLQVSASTETELVDVSFVGSDPATAADVVNRVVKAFVERTYRLRYESLERRAIGPLDQLKLLEVEVAKSEQRMLDLQRQLGLPGFNTQYNQLSRSLEDMTNAVDEAIVTRIAAQTAYRSVHAGGLSLDDTPGDLQTELLGLEEQVSQAKATYARLSATEGSRNPQRMGVAARLRALQAAQAAGRARVEAAALERMQLAEQTEEGLRKTLADRLAETNGMGKVNAEYSAATRDFLEARTLYTELYTHIRTVELNSALARAQVEVVDLAQVPVTPLPQPFWVLVGRDFGLLLFAGFLITLYLENVRYGFDRLDQVEATTGVQGLGVLPRLKMARPHELEGLSVVGRNLEVVARPDSGFAESVQAMMTAVKAATRGYSSKVLLLTSATPSDGKTTVACNLAVLLAQKGDRILLIDADMRRPNVHHRFGLSGRAGLSSVLSGVSFAECVQPVPDVPGLDVLTSGPLPPNPAELLGMGRMAALLESVGAEYSRVIVDTPPVVLVTDAQEIARGVDAVVLVVRAGKTGKGVVQRARDLLLAVAAPLAGVVLNGVEPKGYAYAEKPRIGERSRVV